MNNQIDKLQILLTLEKGLFKEQYQHQKKQAVLTAITVALFILILLFVNVAIFCHISDLPNYARSAWIITCINGLLAMFPLGLLLSTRQRTASKNAANEVREALIADFKDNIASSIFDVKESIEKVQSFSKDIKTFSEGGLTALIPIIKLASGIVDNKSNKTNKNKAEEK